MYEALIESFEIILFGSLIVNYCVAVILDILGLGRSRYLAPLGGTAVSWLIIWITVKTTQTLPEGLMWTALIIGVVCTALGSLFISTPAVFTDMILTIFEKVSTAGKNREKKPGEREKSAEREKATEQSEIQCAEPKKIDNAGPRESAVRGESAGRGDYSEPRNYAGPRYCRMCGKPLRPGVKFCVNCGWRVGNTFSSRRKWIVTGSVAAVVFLVLLVFVCWKYTDRYFETASREDQSQWDKSTDKKEKEYLEKIASRPAKAESYVELAKIYMARHDHAKAEEILKKGKDAGCGKELDGAVAYVKSWEHFEDYIASGQDQEKRMETGVKQNSCDGLLSAFIEDMDGDGALELITLSCTFDENYSNTESQVFENIWPIRGLVLTLRMYGYEKESVVLKDEQSFPCGGTLEHYRYDLFLHKTGDQYGLVLTLNGGRSDSSESTIRLFTFDGGKIQKAMSADRLSADAPYIEFWINDEKKVYYSYYDDEDAYAYNDEEEEEETDKKLEAAVKKHKQEALKKVIAEYTDAFAAYGLENKLDFDQGDIDRVIKGEGRMPSFSEYDQNDPGEKHVACIEVGTKGDGDDTWVQPFQGTDADGQTAGMFYFEDYSGRDEMKMIEAPGGQESVDAKVDEASLKDFLERFVFFSAAVNEGEDFDCQKTDPLKVMNSIMWNISCVDYDRYPGQKHPEELSEEEVSDPRMLMWDDEDNMVLMCYPFFAEKVNWIMKNIFHYSQSDIDDAVARSEASLKGAAVYDRATKFYHEGLKYYYLTAGIGWETEYNVTIDRLDYDDGVYNVEYTVREAFMPGTDSEEIKTHTNRAKMEYKKIEGKYYWTLLENRINEVE